MRRPIPPQMLAVGLIAMLACRPAIADSNLLATAPIDTALFRDGEVRRTAEVYGSWTLVCDAIARLNHRFCSLRASSATLGAGRLDLTVSTGDDGRPAALLRLPLGLSLAFGVRVDGRGEARPDRRIPIALCSATSCEAAWSLSREDLAKLSAGQGLRVSVQGWHATLSGRQSKAAAPTTALIGGPGFAAAISASLR